MLKLKVDICQKNPSAIVVTSNHYHTMVSTVKEICSAGEDTWNKGGKMPRNSSARRSRKKSSNSKIRQNTTGQSQQSLVTTIENKNQQQKDLKSCSEPENLLLVQDYVKLVQVILN